MHPKNLDFQWQDSVQPNGTVTAERASQYAADGAFVVADAFSVDEIDAVVSSLDPIEEAAEAELKAQPNAQYSIARAEEIVFKPHLVADNPALAKFSRHRVFLELCAAILGPDARLYWDQLVYKKPHTVDEFPWHQDNGYTYVEPQQYLTCWVALTDATEANGCPWIAPGLHRDGTLLHRWTDLGFECFAEHKNAVALPLRAGSIAVFSSLTPHRTGPNLTAHTRKAYILQYAPDGARMFPHGQEPLLAANADWQYPVLRDGQAVS